MENEGDEEAAIAVAVVMNRPELDKQLVVAGEEMQNGGKSVPEALAIVEHVGKKRKWRRKSKVARMKAGEDICFVCFDGGDLVLCQRSRCPKAYHPSCVDHDEAFFRGKGRWKCGWHVCNNCEKNAYYMCCTCTFSLCKRCIKDVVFLCFRGNKGFCETCIETVTMIERNDEQARIYYNEKSICEYLFKDYWMDLKQRLSITMNEVNQAKNLWKGSVVLGDKEESLVEDGNNGLGSGPVSWNTETSILKKSKPKKQMKSSAKEIAVGADGASIDGRVQWASNELLEFVMHMRNGDKSILSQFDAQALLLEYIGRNKLRDPLWKNQIICDSRLQSLFGRPCVRHFEMLKLLKSHFLVEDDAKVVDFQGSVIDTIDAH